MKEKKTMKNNYTELTKKELTILATKKNIKINSKDTKGTIIKTILASEKSAKKITNKEPRVAYIELKTQLKAANIEYKELAGTVRSQIFKAGKKIAEICSAQEQIRVFADKAIFKGIKVELSPTSDFYLKQKGKGLTSNAYITQEHFTQFIANCK